MSEITIIVPVYKVEKYLAECLDSLRSQKMTDIEILLIDDGSPDSSGEICNAYAAEDKRIRVIHQENAGVSAARNRGIDEAQGKYICFVDSDDVVDCEYCSVLYGMLQGTSFDFSACAVQRFCEGEDRNGAHENLSYQPTAISNTAYLKRQLEKKSEIGPIDKLFRKEALQSIRFAENRRYEDVVFSADLAQYLKNGVIYTEQTLYYYRMQPESFMATQAMVLLGDFVVAGEHMIEVSKTKCPELLHMCLKYAVTYPWYMVDTIYVKRSFMKNRRFLNELQGFLQRHIQEYEKENVVTGVMLRRMKLFAKSRFLYGLNAYARLLRVYLYRILGKDAYADGHGI